MGNFFYDRHNTVGAIFVLYFVPLVFLTFYGMDLLSAERSWSMLATGLFLSATGTVLFFLLLKVWERQHLVLTSQKEDDHYLLKAMTPANEDELPLPTTHPYIQNEESEQAYQQEIDKIQHSVAEFQKKEEGLRSEIEIKNFELKKLEEEKAISQKMADEIFQEFSCFKDNSVEELDQRKALLMDHQETISEQRGIIKQKQDQIQQLEDKINDLSYEVKTLLQIADVDKKETSTPKRTEILSQEEPSVTTGVQVATEDEATLLLKRCVNMAQKITGANHFNPTSRFRDLQIDNYALDQRRLFDALRSENSGVIFVYSHKENKLLFANSQVKVLMGWFPEKFIQDFFGLIQEGLQDLKQSISQLTAVGTSHIPLLIKTKTGDDIMVYCQIGMIPTGLFKGQVIGILYQSTRERVESKKPSGLGGGPAVTRAQL